MKIGFIGLGVMGRPMAGHLQAAGHAIYSCANRTPMPDELRKGGAVACATPGDVAAEAECLFLMLPDTPDVERVLFGADGAAQRLKRGTIVIDMSSIDPIATRDFAERIETLDCAYVDAPVSGGEVGAKNAALTIMCGGKADVFDTVRPLLELMGKNVTLVGDAGAGQVTKVANQIIVALNIEAVSEALVFASKAGADPARVREALMGGFAASRVLEVHGQRMIERTFDPGFRIRLHQKDLNLALSGARSLGVSLPATANAQQLLSSCVAHGDAEKDHSAMVTALERAANHFVSVYSS
ncbi:2-hydroxy-3-oxopropionate reductase [Sphingobium vermicomposti]|uniref:2-hydroxy-3-oxopropionate reductase n=1 Tax=Sphingobium vermicomposti TaxID=529005 RepID=A0A846M646_9SPHN|nr:2-hydroxy-3-oxopropionate reductase [Sphingobium vermicomposti]NIJ15554.1 2-hydroxy-3-oxopropionate reductase [Sphingobium vermicomposti]